MAVELPKWDSQETYTEPLIHLMRELKPNKVLEIGLGQWGFSTRIWLQEGADLTCIDKGDWNSWVPVFEEKFPQFKFIGGRSEIEVPKLKDKFELIFIDGDHAYEGCKADIINCQRKLSKGGVILMDDYGVEYSAVDVNANGDPIDGKFGVKQACDELFKDWEQVYTHINFANGARVYAKP